MRSIPANAGLALLALLSTSACEQLDVVAKRYDTLAEFEDRGWLAKNILPPSTRNILTVNNLDINISHGRFEFDPKDAPVFVAKVEAGPPARRSNPDRSDIVEQFRSAGLTVWHYSDGGSDWALFCDLHVAYCEAYCEYRMWPQT
jgi:hypothetical protein